MGLRLTSDSSIASFEYVVSGRLGFTRTGVVGVATGPSSDDEAKAGAGHDGELIASTDPGGHFVRDVEGVAIAKTSGGDSYLFVSNQGAAPIRCSSLSPPMPK